MPRQKLVARGYVNTPSVAPKPPKPVNEITREQAIAELSEILGVLGKDWTVWQTTGEASKSLTKVFRRGFSDREIRRKREYWTEGVHYRKQSSKTVLYNIPAIAQLWYKGLA